MTNSSGRILTVNGGSSSIKFALFEAGSPPIRKLSGAIERIGSMDALLKAKGQGWPEEIRPLPSVDYEGAIQALLDWLGGIGDLNAITAIGHRIVHGGPNNFSPQILTHESLAVLRDAIPFAPNHLPVELELVDTFAKRFPTMTQIACFDTSFHYNLPFVAAQFPIPNRYYEAGIRRYGFHGLSFEYLMEELARQAGAETAYRKTILAHLGSGSSLAAVFGGECVDTTMGLTPTGGLMMATRSGDLDPGILLHLMRTENRTADQLDHLVNRESGLLGVSETTADMREIVAKRKSDLRAEKSFHMFCYSVRKGIGAMAAAMDGVNTLIFAGGIGEHSVEVRAEVLDGLGFLGIRLDEIRNEANAPVISTSNSPCTVRVIATDEEIIIAQNVYLLTGGISQPSKDITHA